ncbi:hypothetical protein PSTG_18219 [Puccinia striiformis f. sp. tritici PST-78]|uniref:Uncharacterized protein n=1 Tax=Puccinia striiformis f. sp. tritici PST-78 TaxID=1165861 RepID=A0A0L0UN27_9BASI|nr:hypothetical protein PSTG_18219 [Puccinia striiformis f. sp. tritici PST-78]
MSFNRPPSYASEHSHEDMLDAYSLRDGPFSVNDIPGIATASCQTPSYSWCMFYHWDLVRFSV